MRRMIRRREDKALLFLAAGVLFVCCMFNADTAQAGWLNQTASTASTTATFTSIVLDKNDNPHIAYYIAGNSKQVFIADYSGSSWTTTAPDAAGNEGNGCALAIDTFTGRYYLSYQDSSPKREYFAKRVNNYWTAMGGGAAPTQVATNISEIGASAIALSSGGANTHITYLDSNLKYAVSTDSGAFAISDIDATATVGQWSDIFVASFTSVHVSYYDPTNGDLKYAFYNGSAWTVATIASVGTVGLYTSIAVDSATRVHISYYDSTNGDLKYIYRTSTGGWISSSVDSLGDVGQFTSIGLVGTQPHIAYYDVSNTNLKYAKLVGNAWTVETVDAVGSVGTYASLKIDSANQPHISSFYAASSSQYLLRWAKKGASKPDIMAKNSADGAYTGDNTYNTNATGQTVGANVSPLTAAVFHYQVQNDGATANVTMTGTAGDANFTISYYDALTGGNNITANMTGAGHTLTALTLGVPSYIRAEVTPTVNAALDSSKNIQVTATSEDASDVAIGSITVTAVFQPDVKIKKSADGSYTGSNIYNQDGSFQAVSESIVNRATATYHICLRNNGNIAETFVVTGTVGTNGWNVFYFDALAAGNNITQNVTGAGWTSPSLTAGASTFLRMEVSPASGTFSGGQKNIYFFSVQSSS